MKLRLKLAATFLLAFGSSLANASRFEICRSAVIADETEDKDAPRDYESLWKETITQTLTFLKSLVDGDPQNKTLRANMRKLLMGDRELRASLPAFADIFEGLDLLLLETSLRTNALNVTSLAPEDMEKASQEAGDFEIINLLKAYLYLLDVEYEEIKNGKAKLLVIKPDENGIPIQQFAANVFRVAGYRIGIDTNLKAIGYLQAKGKILHVGLESLFTKDFRASSVLQHELVHLKLMYNPGAYFSAFTSSIRSKSGAIDVPHYRKFFHTSEQLAYLQSVTSTLVNLLTLQNNPVHIAQRLKIHLQELRGYNRYYVDSVRANIEIQGSLLSAIANIKSLDAKPTTAGLQVLFETSTKSTEISKYKFNRLFIDIQSDSYHNSGALVFSSDTLHLTIPISPKLQEGFKAILGEHNSGRLSQKELNDKIINFLGKFSKFYRNALLTAFHPNAQEFWSTALSNYNRINAIVGDIEKDVQKYVEHFQELVQIYQQYEELENLNNKVFVWPDDLLVN